MTDDYKKNILAYLCGKIEKSIGDDKPQFNEWEVTNNSIKSQIADKLNIDVSEVVIYNYLSSNSNDLILIYGRYSSSGYNPYIAMMSSKGIILQVITTFDSGLKLFNIVGMRIDEDNSIYAVSSEGSQDGSTVRVLLLNNIFVSNLKNGDFYVKIKKSYVCPLDFWISSINPTKYRITKGGNDTYFLLGFPRNSESSLDTSIVKFKINIAGENEWNIYNISNSGLDRTLFSTSIKKTNEDFYFYCYGFDFLATNQNTYSEYELSPTGNITIKKRITFDYSISFAGSQVVYLDEDNKYLTVQDNTNKKSFLYLLKTTNEDNLIEIDTLNWYDDSQGRFIKGGFYIQNIGNTLFVTKNIVNDITNPDTTTYLGVIKDENVYYEIQSIKKNTKEASSKEDFFRTNTYILKNYNLFNILINSNYNNNVENNYLNETYLIYNNDNYNGKSYTNINSMVPNQGILYDSQNKPIFSRNLYNKTITGRTTQSTVEVPNNYLNDKIIEKENLLSETNSILISNNQTITKNIYETLNINFINTLQIKNDNDETNSILNPIGASRLNNSISNLADYDNAKMGKYRINYSDNTNRIINNIWAPIGNFYRTNINIYVNKEIKSIDFISDDENTIYCSISPILEINKIYKIKQDVYIDEKIQPSDIYYNNNEVFYNNEKVYY